MAYNIDVTVRGPFFDKKIDQVVQDAIVAEALEKIGARTERGGRGLGSKRNTISLSRSALVLEVASTKRFPRTRGTSWQRKNVGIVRAMAGRVLRSVAKRITAEL